MTKYVLVLAARFFLAPELSASHESLASKNKGRRSADRRGPPAHQTDARVGHRTIHVRTAPLRARRAPCAKAPSPVGAPPRLLPKASRPLAPVRSRASWQRQRGCSPVRRPGSQLLADRRRGRPGEFPNRLANRLARPIRGTAPARINRPSPVDVPSTSEMCSLYFVARCVTRQFGRWPLSI